MKYQLLKKNFNPIFFRRSPPWGLFSSIALWRRIVWLCRMKTANDVYFRSCQLMFRGLNKKNQINFWLAYTDLLFKMSEDVHRVFFVYGKIGRGWYYWIWYITDRSELIFWLVIYRAHVLINALKPFLT